MRSATVRPVRCVVVGGSLVGLSTAIALSRLGMDARYAGVLLWRSLVDEQAMTGP